MVTTKSEKVLRTKSYVCRSYRGKTSRGSFCPPSWIGLRECTLQGKRGGGRGEGGCRTFFLKKEIGFWRRWKFWNVAERRKVKVEPSTFVSIISKKWSCIRIYLFIYKLALFLLLKSLTNQCSTFLLEIEMSFHESCPDNAGVLVNALIFGWLDWFRLF